MLRTLFAETFVGEHVIVWPWLAREWDDGRLVDEALRWSDGVEGPFLLYVHLMDAHMPYRRPAIDGRGWRQRRLESLRTGMRVSPEEASDVVAFYDGGLRSATDAADRVLDAAERWRRPYVAIVTADHGESLGEGGRWAHGKTLAPELLDVPLLVLGDGVTPGRVEKPVGHASVAETLLRAAGAPGDTEGGSDLRTSDGDAVVEGFLPPVWSYRVAHGYQAVTDAARGEVELFDLRRDPRREHDLSQVHPKLARALAVGLSRGRPTTPDSGTLERLRALGYVDD
jgi:arylsulfatase A-like enzyme